mmetsp:Transcript_136789/g.266064  ORF Transcript_136789/g.266064 Transcript_136789/m.266064 type:complete len:290 (-) Transcript_136789:384-1253(-)
MLSCSCEASCSCNLSTSFFARSCSISWSAKRHRMFCKESCCCLSRSVTCRSLSSSCLSRDANACSASFAERSRPKMTCSKLSNSLCIFATTPSCFANASLPVRSLFSNAWVCTWSCRSACCNRSCLSDAVDSRARICCCALSSFSLFSRSRERMADSATATSLCLLAMSASTELTALSLSLMRASSSSTFCWCPAIACFEEAITCSSSATHFLLKSLNSWSIARCIDCICDFDWTWEWSLIRISRTSKSCSRSTFVRLSWATLRSLTINARSCSATFLSQSASSLASAT